LIVGVNVKKKLKQLQLNQPLLFVINLGNCKLRLDVP